MSLYILIRNEIQNRMETNRTEENNKRMQVLECWVAHSRRICQTHTHSLSRSLYFEGLFYNLKIINKIVCVRHLSRINIEFYIQLPSIAFI